MDLVSNLLSGLVGAVIGLVGAFGLHWYDSRQGGKAAARAVFMEVAANGAALHLAMKHGVYATLTSATWAQSHVALSQALSPAEFAKVATFYMHVEAMLSAGFVPGHPDPRLGKIAPEVFARSAAAARVLEEKGWKPGERAELEEAVKDFLPKS